MDAEIGIEPEAIDESKDDHDNMPSQDNPIGVKSDDPGTANDDTHEFKPTTDEMPTEATVSPTQSSKSPKAKMKPSFKPDVAQGTRRSTWVSKTPQAFVPLMKGKSYGYSATQIENMECDPRVVEFV